MTRDPAQDLVVAASGGDEKAWKELFNKYLPVVWQATAGFRLSSSDREDATQETFLRLIRHIHRFDPKKASLGTYLSVIARNICIDLTRAKSRQTESIDPEYGPGIAPPNAPDQEAVVRVRIAMDRELSPEQRLCLKLFYYEGLNYEEIARSLGREYHWVKNTLHASRILLRQALEKRFEM